MADTTATLVFTEYPDDEIVVRLAPVPMRDYFALVEEWDATERFGDFVGVFTRFIDAGLLVSWTFPEPCDLDGFLARDLKLGMAIVRQWFAGVAEVPRPLPLQSSDGTPSTPETSQPNSPEPSSSTMSSDAGPATPSED